MKKYLMLIALSLVLITLNAQASVFESNPFRMDNPVGHLFNPYKLKMSHSMGFSAGTSSNGLGFYESRYTNHLFYEFNPKLNLALDLNLVNYGSVSSGQGFSFDSNDDNKTKIIPEFSLNYKPSDAVSIRLEYRNLRGYNPWLPNRLDWME